jgi:spermidine/putrescine transport system ATP-binding protein
VNTVFQKYALFTHLNVFENIAFGLRIAKLPENEIKKRVFDVLELVNLSDYDQRAVSQLSGGQQQRIAIARAIVNRPQVLLLDEPLGALDLKLRKDMQVELKKIQKQVGITFIYVTHDQEEALTMSDTVVVMDKGVILQTGTPTDIYNEPENAFVADFIGESNIIDGIMTSDLRVRMYGRTFPCLDEGFAPNEPVDVVVRPEDIDIVPAGDGQITGTVTEVTFKGMQYDIIVDFQGFKWLIQTTDICPVGAKIGVKIDPDGIHIMKKSAYSGKFGDYSSYSAEYDELSAAPSDGDDREEADDTEG